MAYSPARDSWLPTFGSKRAGSKQTALAAGQSLNKTLHQTLPARERKNHSTVVVFTQPGSKPDSPAHLSVYLLTAISGNQRLAARIPNHEKGHFIGCAEWRNEIMLPN